MINSKILHMKKIYLLTFSLFALSQLNAQTSYTLTQANSEPMAGDSYGSVNLDTNGTALPMSISGANVNWNITNILGDTTVVNTYSTAASDANSGNYPGTNLVQTDSTTLTYYKSSPGMLELLGVDVTGQFNLNYNTGSATIATYPASFGYTNTDNTVSGDISAAGFSGNFTGTLVTTADGTGTLDINNVSNFTNCVRIKTVQNIDFDLAGFIQGTIEQTLYNYYHSSSKFPIFSVSYSHVSAPAAAIDQVQAQVNTLSTVAIGVKENKLNDVIFKTYPNPANNEINIHFVLAQPESYTVEISNTLGQVVKTVSLNNLQPGMYNESINTSNLSAGIYTIKVSGKKTQGTEKLVIQK